MAARLRSSGLLDLFPDGPKGRPHQPAREFPATLDDGDGIPVKQPRIGINETKSDPPFPHR